MPSHGDAGDVLADGAGDVRDGVDGGRPPDASLVVEAGCFTAPPRREFPLLDASCGTGCVRLFQPSPAREFGVIRERDGELEIPAAEFAYYRPGSRTFDALRASVQQPTERGLCNATIRGTATGFGVDGNALLFGCLNEDEWTLLRLSDDRSTTCSLFRMSLGTSLGFAPTHLTRVRGAYAWVQGYLDQGPGDLTVLDEGSTTPRRITGCDCVLEAGGADDTIVFVKDSPTRVFAELWMLRPPYREARKVWDPDMTMLRLAQDPTDPHRFVFAGHRSGPNCEAGADIYLFDTRTIDREPPRRLTNSATTQVWPVVRGDWVAYLDYSRDTLNPNGCVEDDHNAFDRVLQQVSTGRRIVLQGGDTGGSITYALFRTHALVGAGYIVPLPPEARQ